MKSGIVKKYQIAPFLGEKKEDGSIEWIRIKKSTSFELQMNPDVKEYDYIADESPTKELDKYVPSLNAPITMYKGEPDYTLIWERFFNLKTGEDAKAEFLLVFYHENLDTPDGDEKSKVYKAWNASSVISISSLNSVDATITCDINLGGTIKRGYISVTEEGKAVFTEGEYYEPPFEMLAADDVMACWKDGGKYAPDDPAAYNGYITGTPPTIDKITSVNDIKKYYDIYAKGILLPDAQYEYISGFSLEQASKVGDDGKLAIQNVTWRLTRVSDARFRLPQGGIIKTAPTQFRTV